MIRVFVGTSEHSDDKDAERVLEYTLRKNCPEEIDLVFMRNSDQGFFGGNFVNSDWWTPFSLLRWAIPEYCNFEGRALYLDVDQVNFKNIADLYYMDMRDKAVAVREPDKRTCVMLMDCKKLREKVPSVQKLKTGMYSSEFIKNITDYDSTVFDARWNCLDGEDRRVSDIWHLHFTEMTTQPWNPKWAYKIWSNKGHEFKPAEHPRGDLVYIWKYLLEESNNV